MSSGSVSIDFMVRLAHYRVRLAHFRDIILSGGFIPTVNWLKLGSQDNTFLCETGSLARTRPFSVRLAHLQGQDLSLCLVLYFQY